MDKKILIVYYSLDGNTRFVAENIAKNINADLLELKPIKEGVPRNFAKYFWGGRQVYMKQKPLLCDFGLNPGNYEIIFIGTPVWAFNYTPVIASFFDKVKLEKKKIALFCCSGGVKGKTFEKMKEKLCNNEFIGEFHLFEPLFNKKRSALKIKKWVEKLNLIFRDSPGPNL
ncbi:MAG: flavodoxin [Candidatus Omnitrophota bacterium]